MSLTVTESWILSRPETETSPVLQRPEDEGSLHQQDMFLVLQLNHSQRDSS